MSALTTDRIQKQVVLRVPPARVWQALADFQEFGSWFGVELSAENGRMLYVPELCAHGYQALRDDTEMFYMTSAAYAPHSAHGVRFDDPAFGIEWPLAATAVSEQDRNWPLSER